METIISQRQSYQASSTRAILLLSCMLTFHFASAGLTAAQEMEIKEQRSVATLEERLTSGLRARTEKEKQYIKNVALFVQQGKLPKSLVDSTFLWVQRRKAGGNYPIFYFKRVLELRAKALRISVPR